MRTFTLSSDNETIENPNFHILENHYNGGQYSYQYTKHFTLLNSYPFTSYGFFFPAFGLHLMAGGTYDQVSHIGSVTSSFSYNSIDNKYSTNASDFNSSTVNGTGETTGIGGLYSGYGANIHWKIWRLYSSATITYKYYYLMHPEGEELKESLSGEFTFAIRF